MATAKAENKGQGRTASKEVRRQQLIDATIDSIATRGFADTTIAAVSQGANLSQGLINLHFNNKDTLFQETLGYLAGEHHERWSTAVEMAGSEADARLAALLEVDFLPEICSQRKLAAWFAFWGQAKQRPSYQEKHNAFDRQRGKLIETLCEQIVEEGGYSHLDAKSVARSIVAMVDGLWLNHMLYPETNSREQAREDCFAFLANLFSKHFGAPGPSRYQ